MAKRKRHPSKSTNSNHTSLEKHTRAGSKLMPPLAQLPNMNPSSWRDNRLPEMIWAGLLFSTLPRNNVFKKMKELVTYLSKYRDSENPIFNISLSGIAQMPLDKQEEIIHLISTPDEFAKALSPLLLFDSLPIKDKWEKYLSLHTPEWKPLMVSVAKLLDHQSQESTDCRWVRVVCMIAAGQLSFPKEMEEVVKGIVYYPDYGDLRVVRPTIRSTEGGLAQLLDQESSWSNEFWAECLEKTGCFPLLRSNQETFNSVTTIEKIKSVYSDSIDICNKTRITTAVDSKHETIFGMIFYSLRLLMELMRTNASQSISAQLVLRSLVECYITLTYLIKKGDDTLWKSYRVFGSGQAKLSYLKLELNSETTNYVNVETLQELANEDIWEEFLPIELGHWTNSNLRKLSEEAGIKEIYDQYYPWTSSYLHGHWGSIRDTVYETCGNPLHRLHRIPSTQLQSLPDVLPDACRIVDLILGIASSCYPEIQLRVSS
ncbi:MAG: hypothetical protein KBG83_07785 [Bacteroidetes bacterium]|nr:hypothetical protein [Bacteroidota bacterium]